MTATPTVLVLGGTGRTGGRVIQQLLGRGARVRAVVRARARLPAAVVDHPALTVIEASPLVLADGELRRHLDGCDAVVSCLGHTISLRGVFGPPRDLVTRSLARACRAIEALAPARPVKVVLMTSVSVHRPLPLDGRRGRLQRAFLWLVRALVPPAKDNQRAADLLRETIGPAHPAIEWAVVRPDSLADGEVSPYAVHEELVHHVLAPGHTRMANVAHFLCELVTEPAAWTAWKGKLPVIVDEDARR